MPHPCHAEAGARARRRTRRRCADAGAHSRTLRRRSRRRASCGDGPSHRDPIAMTPVARRLALTLAGFGSLATVAILLAPLAGSTAVDLRRVFDRSIPYSENVDAQIFF